jgi:hypothetical protein
MSFSPFSYFKTSWIFKFITFLDFALKLPKRDTSIWQIGQSDFSSLAKFGHQHMPPAF